MKYRPFLVDDKPRPACAVFTFIYSTGEPRSARGSAASCNGARVEDLVSQATLHYDNADPVAALAAMKKALACEQNRRMYLLAGLFACAAHDVEASRDFVAKIPAALRAGVSQRCLLEGIPLDPAP